MAQIVPAILENTKEGFLDRMSRVVKLPGVERIQVDFGDGVFVPNNILPIDQIDTLNPAFHWEAHLMIKEPNDFLDYKICGFKTLIVHYEAYQNTTNIKNALEEIRKLGLRSGLAINPDTAVSILQEFNGFADQFLIMSLNPGFQGHPFLPSTIDRLKELRALIPHAIIEVDGGINLSNVKAVVQTGCDLISVGSTLTKAPDMLLAYEQLQKEISQI